MRWAIEDGFGGLRVRWRGRPDVFVGADQFVYWDPDYDQRTKSGNPPLSPDVYVAFGVANRHRSSYVVWDEGKPPDFVLEVASPSSRQRDENEKRDAYAKMGVPEYFPLRPAWRAEAPAVGFSNCATASTANCRRRRSRKAWSAFAARRSDCACA